MVRVARFGVAVCAVSIYALEIMHSAYNVDDARSASPVVGPDILSVTTSRKAVATGIRNAECPTCRVLLGPC